MNPDLLIKHLVTRGLVNEAETTVVLNDAKAFKGTFEDTLVENGLLKEEELLQAMSEVYDIPLVKLNASILDAKLAASLPSRLLETYGVYPLKKESDNEEIRLAMTDPFDISALDMFRHITGCPVKPVLALKSEIKGALSGSLLGKVGLQLIAERVPWDQALEAIKNSEYSDLDSEHSTPIVQLVAAILNTAFRAKSSDIHFEPQEDYVRVRYRIDGILQEIVKLPTRVSRACVARMKIISDLDISESRKPQDGRTQLRLPDGDVDMRVSTLPTVWGEKVVMRLLDRTGEPPTLSQLGFSQADLKLFKSFLQASSGMILLTGPTGSGKTSTLYAALQILNKPGVNISTVEDPVEYQMAGVNQVAVNKKAGLTFSVALRSFLRQDPDIIMVGEMRDLETAEIGVQAAQTGHLVFSTLHTNDAPATLERLLLMGLAPHMVSGSLICVVAQRLVRRLCTFCRKESRLTGEQRLLLSKSYEERLPKLCWAPVGCPECHHTGYKGRLGLFELLPVTDAIKQQILENASEQLLWEVARKEGLKTLLEDGLDKVEKGLTSINEVLRVVTIKRKSRHRSSAPAEPSHSSTAASTHHESVANRAVQLFSLPTIPFEWKPPVRVVDVMTPEVFTVNKEEPVSNVVEKFIEWRVTGAVVTENDQVVGVLSLNDIALSRYLETSLEDVTVEALMSPWVIKVHPYTPLRRALILFRRHRVHRLVVMKEKQLLGIITPMDLISRADRFCSPLNDLWNQELFQFQGEAETNETEHNENEPPPPEPTLHLST